MEFPSLCYSVVPRSCPVPTQRPLCPCSSKKAVLYLLVSEACGGLSQALQSAPHCGPPPPPSCEDGLAPFWPRVCFDEHMTLDSPRGKGGFHSATVQQEYILGRDVFMSSSCTEEKPILADMASSQWSRKRPELL